MTLLAAFLLCQNPATDFDRLVRDLGHERIEVRERAHARLLSLGAPAIPALRRVISSEDAELHLRATAILEALERSDRERIHDADQMAALLFENRTQADILRERSPGSAATKGARFNLAATAFDDGWVIATGVTDYLDRRSDSGPGKGRVRFDVRSISASNGRDLTIERCGRCSPGKVFVKKSAGALTVRITGEQLWLSPYPLEFKDPFEGQSKRVGDFSITVAWPALRVSSERPFLEEWIPSMGSAFKCTQKEGIGLNGRDCGMAIG